MVSITTEPVITWAVAEEETTGRSAPRSAWRTTTMRSRRPLARAVRT